MVFRPSIVGVLLLDLALTVAGQQAVWGQCGGIGWTGATNCVSGACCQYQNDWYSQCLPGDCSPGGGQPTTTSSPGNPTTTSSNPGGPTSTNVSSGCGSSSGMNSGTKSITVNGKQRQYILTLPQNYNSNTPYKLFFGLHWLSGTMQDVAGGNYYGVQPLSNNGAIFVAPQGLNNGWANSGGEDITLMDDILSTLQSGLCIDNNHIYSMGWSYGGAMSYALACARPNVFRGVAALSGANLSGCSPGTQPVAYYGQHGVSDDVLNISMGRSIRDTFVRNNGCNSANPQEPSAGSGTHIKTVYTGCSSGHPVWWTAFDGGHDPLPKDRNSGTSWTSGELWNFFSQLD